jgi:protein-S-isoprenylcysteine O-methyltransferase Ste14
MTSALLALRSLFWACVIPGLIAGYVPWRYFGIRDVRLNLANPLHVAAMPVLAAGVLLLAACIVEFTRSGRGTLSPLDPPRQLVVRGLYRYVRNPMYLSVTVIAVGEIILAPSRALAIYWIIWFAWVNIFVIGYEEPALRRQFGPSYDEYTRRVRRWIPRFSQ